MFFPWSSVRVVLACSPKEEKKREKEGFKGFKEGGLKLLSGGAAPFFGQGWLKAFMY